MVLGHYVLIMKKIILISLSIVFGLLIMSCDKGDSVDIPTSEVLGDYLYSSSSAYYDAMGLEKTKATSDGSLFIIQFTEMSIEVTPSIGYAYTFKATDIVNHGDTTTFRIRKQQISVNNIIFNLEGNNSIDVGSIGYYDGYYTDKKIVFAYRSINIENLDYAITRTDAIKRN